MSGAGCLKLKKVVVKRIIAIKFRVNYGCGNGTGCGGVKVKVRQ